MAAERRPPRVAWKKLQSICAQLTFERHDIASQLDQRRRYDLVLDREFPFNIRLFHFQSGQFTAGPTWHERLELFLPVSGQIRLRMGESTIALTAGDLLVVDNLKLHNVEEFSDLDSRVVVISFLPEFVYSLGSPSHDYTFLLPFYARVEGKPHILRAGDELADSVHAAVTTVLSRYFKTGVAPHREAGCKAAFLELLLQLAQRFHTSEVLHSEFLLQQQRAARLARLFEFIRLNYAQKISVAEAANLVHMSEPQFMKVFKKVSGMTFVAYVTHVRLASAVPLLKSSPASVAEIANSVGFSDQSYFDRRFKQAFGCSPREFRSRPHQGPPPNKSSP